MMIKCSECGIEYSYGRNICHICKDHTIFFGALFKGNREEYNWNCNNKACLESNKIKSFKKKYDDKLHIDEILNNDYCLHEWNCETDYRVIQVPLSNKNLAHNLNFE